MLRIVRGKKLAMAGIELVTMTKHSGSANR
jgi:hypothetical protein